MKHSVLSCINSLVTLYARSPYAPTHRRLLRGITHRGGELRDVGSVFVACGIDRRGNSVAAAARLLTATVVKADEESASVRDRAHELRERAFPSTPLDDEHPRHCNLAIATAIMDPGDDGHRDSVGPRGSHVDLVWEKREEECVASGVYFHRLQGRGISETRKLAMTK